ncbi:hypothetical protein CDAR_450201 [Caerostris darwini]|uniref:Uncharacterized protein n=1 Tax=Caerostris darwini TaxID=1538125 RepID=A0AAV4PZD9_9ARAC|nr:hypothetical protein CDAR_450201 [Caerostris darwini]
MNGKEDQPSEGAVSEAADRRRTNTLLTRNAHPHNGKRPAAPLDAPRTSEIHIQRTTPLLLPVPDASRRMKRSN